MARALDTQLRIFREITCAQAVLDDPASAPGEIARVLRAATDYSRPVYIEVPRDMVGAEVAAVQPFPSRPVSSEALTECADEIVG
jgi:indolepyruvate decarboxylase